MYMMMFTDVCNAILRLYDEIMCVCGAQLEEGGGGGGLMEDASRIIHIFDTPLFLFIIIIFVECC